ncbi:hypothetical protein JTE90_008002 [Oedothorax gibbosus]|uniref:Endonuclease/exonuclease/phosphatase domain-containing protein n=1 Tax=Oedothorax gibbosus TaxID=931172 RepID=A0AAV6UY46_9ARAC|nr:hypothetical protein JTE90_008002 [Oedothorax gibbosus]
MSIKIFENFTVEKATKKVKMASKVYFFFCILSFTILWSTAECKTRVWTGKTVERPVRIGSFNIQNLGSSKFGNKTIMDIVKKVLLRYDMILIQEIVTMDSTLMENLVKDINKLHKEKESTYELSISERLGRGTAKEQYAYLYRNDKFKLLGARTYPDKDDEFMRPPYIAKFATPTLRDMESMIVIGVHTQPKYAANETGALANVYDYAAKAFKTKDVILMGDMNAGCANVRISDWDTMELWRRTEFTWLITHDYDTTLSINCCPYDRIVIAGENMGDAYISDSVKAFKYRDLYGLSTDMALAVSDHWPVEVMLRGGTSSNAQSNLRPSLCLTIHDVSPSSLPSQIRNQKTSLGFQISATETSVELYSESSNSTGLLVSLQNLQKKYSQLISVETIEAIEYKVNHGVLDDATSTSDLEKELYSVSIYFDTVELTTTVHYCSATTFPERTYCRLENMMPRCNMVPKLLITIALIVPVFSFIQESKLFDSTIIDHAIDLKNKPFNHAFTSAIQTNAIESPLLLGSFNIQTLGKKKLKDSYVMSTVEKVIHRYDLILIVELMTNDTRLLEKLLRDVNTFAPEGVIYNMTVSSDTVVNEFCAIFYRNDKLKLKKTESYSDPEKFYRKPFLAVFSSPTLRDMQEFGVIGYHVKPSQAVQEINALAGVYDYMKGKYRMEDIIIMGDFNADCTYVGEKDWVNIALWTRPEFTWAIGHHVDTTTNHRSCALDRIVYAGENMNAGVILSSAQIHDFRDGYLLLKEARAVSDHWPVEIKIRGKMSTVAEKHLSSDVCFNVKDSRTPNFSKDEIFNAAELAHFLATPLSSGFNLHNDTKDFESMISALKNLQSFLPNDITHEQIEAVNYKVYHGALDDASSYADEPNLVFKLDLTIVNTSSTILVCRSSTIN